MKRRRARIHAFVIGLIISINLSITFPLLMVLVVYFVLGGDESTLDELPYRFIYNLLPFVGALVGIGIWIALDRRARRLPLDLCPSCGYDLRASKDKCPECGAAIESKAA